MASPLPVPASILHTSLDGTRLPFAAGTWHRADLCRLSFPRPKHAAQCVETSSCLNGPREDLAEMDGARCIGRAAEVLHQAAVLPSLVVLDLDHTIWPFYCQFRSLDYNPVLFPQVLSLLDALTARKIPLAVASRTPTPETARAFLNKLNISQHFVVKEMFLAPSKLDHFMAISEKTKLPLNSFLFFDDEQRNVEEISQLGVTSVQVECGFNLNSLKKGLTLYAERLEL